MSELEQVQTEYACSHCGCRAPATVLLGVGKHAISNAAISLGLQPCPTCGRRDTKLLVMASVMPVVAGLLMGGVIALVGIIAAAAVGIASIVGGSLLGVLVGAWIARYIIRRDLATASFPVIAIDNPIKEDPYRSAPPVRHVPLPSPFTHARLTEAAYVVVLAGAGISVFVWWGQPLTTVPIGITVAGGVIGGLLAGRDRGDRSTAIATMTAIALGVMIASHVYMAGRSIVINYELLIPLAIGASPGLILDRALRH